MEQTLLLNRAGGGGKRKMVYAGTGKDYGGGRVEDGRRISWLAESVVKGTLRYTSGSRDSIARLHPRRSYFYAKSYYRGFESAEVDRRRCPSVMLLVPEATVLSTRLVRQRHVRARRRMRRRNASPPSVKEAEKEHEFLRPPSRDSHRSSLFRAPI